MTKPSLVSKFEDAPVITSTVQLEHDLPGSWFDEIAETRYSCKLRKGDLEFNEGHSMMQHLSMRRKEDWTNGTRLKLESLFYQSSKEKDMRLEIWPSAKTHSIQSLHAKGTD